ASFRFSFLLSNFTFVIFLSASGWLLRLVRSYLSSCRDIKEKYLVVHAFDSQSAVFVNADALAPEIVRRGALKNAALWEQISHSHLANLLPVLPKCEEHEMTDEAGGNEIQAIVFGDEMLAIVSNEKAPMPIRKRPKHFV